MLIKIPLVESEMFRNPSTEELYRILLILSRYRPVIESSWLFMVLICW